MDSSGPAKAPGHADYLAALGEEPLHDAPRTPSVVRVCREAGGWEVIGKVSDTRGELAPGRLAWQQRRLLDARETAQMEQLCDALHFRSMSAEVSRMGMDGYRWFLEGVGNGEYHVIRRWCPEEPPLRAFGGFLLEVSGVRAYRPSPEIERTERLAAEATRQAYDEAAARRSEAIARSNAKAVRMAAQLDAVGLTCPRCHAHTRDIRFFMSDSSQVRSHFVCRLCGCSFDPDDVDDA
jgi:hypothetical protein